MVNVDLLKVLLIIQNNFYFYLIVSINKIIIAGAMYPNYFMVPPLPLPLPSNIEIERNSVWV